jgi:hypothetical protein
MSVGHRFLVEIPASICRVGGGGGEDGTTIIYHFRAYWNEDHHSVPGANRESLCRATARG